MADKYAAKAEAARAERRAHDKATAADFAAMRAEGHRLKSCERKARYPTQALAQEKGKAIYECRHCGGWHRATKKRNAMRNLYRKGHQ